VVAELKVVEDDGMLVQGIDYYDYVARNLDGFANAYKRHKVDPKQELRLFLLAPSFSVTLLNRIKWIAVPISLFMFQCIEFEDASGETIPVYKEVTAPAIPDRVESYSLDDRYNYITDADVGALAQNAVGQIKQWDTARVSADATKYAISIKVTGSVLAYVEPRRRYFYLSTNDADGKWTGYRISDEGDLTEVLVLVKANFDRMTT